jgi:hypothetical protein
MEPWQRILAALLALSGPEDPVYSRLRGLNSIGADQEEDPEQSDFVRKFHPKRFRIPMGWQSVLEFLLDLPREAEWKIRDMTSTSDNYLLVNMGCEFLGSVKDLEDSIKAWCAKCRASRRDLRLWTALVNGKIGRHGRRLVIH